MSEGAIDLIKRFGISKSGIASLSTVIADRIKEGEEDPLLVLANLKAMEQLAKEVKSKIRDLTEDAINDYPEKSFTKHGVKFTKVTRKTYDYSGDAIWKELATDKKDLETLLKAVKSPIADVDTGEMMYPLPFKESESVSITLQQ